MAARSGSVFPVAALGFVVGAALLATLAVRGGGASDWVTDLDAACLRDDRRARVVFLGRATTSIAATEAARPVREWMQDDDDGRARLADTFVFVRLAGARRPESLPRELRDANAGVAILEEDGAWLAWLAGWQPPARIIPFLEHARSLLPRIRAARGRGPAGRAELALLLAELGSAGPAWTHLQAALEDGLQDEPSHTRVLHAAARVAIERGRVSQARQLLARLEARPDHRRDDASCALTWALVRCAEGRRQEARDLLAAALEQYPDAPEAARIREEWQRLSSP